MTDTPKDFSISVIIPTCDGEALLRAHLPALLQEMESYGGESEVILADDGSTDGTETFARMLGPRVRLCGNDGPRGFGRNCNNAARQARHDLLFFLNNDVLVTPGTLSRLARHFLAPDVFGVSPNSLITRAEDPHHEMPTRAIWYEGMVVGRPARAEPPAGQEVQDTFYLCGGFSLIRRRMFEQLGGFDEIFNPFYWEDCDLSICARRRGWRTLHDPAATVYHRHQSTIARKFSKTEFERISWRNAFLFNWKHMSAETLHGLHLPQLFNARNGILQRNMIIYAGFLEALPLYPQICARRRDIEKQSIRTLEEIVNLPALIGQP